MTDRQTIRRWLQYRRDEIDGAMLYRTMSEAEAHPQLKQVYERMAASEMEHAGFWERKLSEAGVAVSRAGPSVRARVLAWLARRCGPGLILPTMLAGEKMTAGAYDGEPPAREARLLHAETSHARLLTALARSHPGGVQGGLLARLEGRHRSVGGNALRAAVLGANDGLCSILSLVMGVAGAGQPSSTVLVAGTAGVLAGACAMAMGEWLSVQSSRELAERQLAVESAELREAPQEELEELTLIYQAKGLPVQEARRVAETLLADHQTALQTLSREELGLEPEELGGSAWEAAIASFLLFVAGSAAPVIPFVFLQGRAAVLASLLASTVALFLIGSAITLLTGRSVLFSGTRQVLIGLGAAGVTFGVGHLIGRLFGITIAG